MDLVLLASPPFPLLLLDAGDTRDASISTARQFLKATNVICFSGKGQVFILGNLVVFPFLTFQTGDTKNWLTNQMCVGWSFPSRSATKFMSRVETAVPSELSSVQDPSALKL